MPRQNCLEQTYKDAYLDYWNKHKDEYESNAEEAIANSLKNMFTNQEQDQLMDPTTEHKREMVKIGFISAFILIVILIYALSKSVFR